MANSIVEQGVQHAAEVAQKGGVLMATGGGLWAWLATNAQAIGAVCAMIGAAVAVLSLLVNLYFKVRGRGA